MPETLVSALVTAKNTLHQMEPWVWIAEINLDGTNGMRLVGHHATVTYAGATYRPFPLAVEVGTRDAQGNVNRARMVVSNVSREVVAYLESGSVLDYSVHLQLMNLTTTASSIDWGWHTMLSASVTLEAVTVELGQYDLVSAQLPSRRQIRSRCDHIYGGIECQYPKTTPNLISGTNPLFVPATCDRGLETSNGCRVHGLNALANGLPLFWPRRFGGEPGIAKGPARV